MVESFQPHGPRGPKDHTSRRTLPPHLADALAQAHETTGGSYRAVAAAIGIDYGYWRRLTRGERCPSREVARQIALVLELDDEVVDALMAVAVVRETGRVVA